MISIDGLAINPSKLKIILIHIHFLGFSILFDFFEFKFENKIFFYKKMPKLPREYNICSLGKNGY